MISDWIRPRIKAGNRHLEFAALSLLLLAGCFFYSFVIPQTPGRMLKPSAALIDALPLWRLIRSLPIPIPTSSQSVAAWLVLFAVVVFAAYGAAICLSLKQQGKMPIAIVMGTTALFLIVSTWALPNVNTDIYHFILHGRIAAVYHSNPYYVLADEFPDDPIYHYADPKYTGRPSDKLPVWMLMSSALARAAGDNPVNNLILFRHALLSFNLANVALIALILHRMAPEFVLRGLVLYAWNPIVIIFAQSKIDTAMIFFMLLAILMLVARRSHLAILALVLSVLVKLITLPLLGVLLLSDLRSKKWRQLLIRLLLVGSLTLLFYLLFWENSAIIRELIRLMSLGGSSAPASARFYLRAGFVILVLGTGLVQDGSLSKLLSGWSIVTLYFSIFLTQLGFAWYLMTLLAIVPFVFDWRITLVTVVLSFSAFSFNSWYSTFTQVFIAPDLIELPRFFVYLSLPLVVMLGIVAFAIWQRSELGQAFLSIRETKSK